MKTQSPQEFGESTLHAGNYHVLDFELGDGVRRIDVPGGGDDFKATQYSEAAISQRQIWILKKHV